MINVKRNIKIHTYRDVQGVNKKIAERINEYIYKNNDSKILLLLSGGSTFSLLPFIDSNVFKSNIIIGVLDERFNSHSKINNFLQLQKTAFYQTALQNGCSFINTSIKKGDTLLEKAKEFENILKRWKKQNKRGKLVITQGIGIDGHTAGIFPFDNKDKDLFRLLTNGKKWVIGYDISTKNPFPLRITPTFYFLREIVDKSFIYAVGIEKKEILKKVIHNNTTIENFPACIIHEMKDIEIYTNVYE